MNAQLALPLARKSDPQTSHQAARTVAPGNSELIRAIRWFVERRGPVTAFEIGDAIAGARWSHATVRTAVARAGLVVVDERGVSPRGRACTRYGSAR